MASHNKMLETQVAQLAQQPAESNRQQGQFTGQPQQNPKERINAVVLRSGRLLSDAEKKNSMTRVGESQNSGKVSTAIEKRKEKVDGAANVPIKDPVVPFPARLAKSKLEAKYGKFLETIKQLHITIPFVDVITEIPSYAKFLKYLLSNKRKNRIVLSEECSALFTTTLPEKLGDPGCFSIPCNIGNLSIQRALCDLGASVSLMPLAVADKLHMGELKATNISLQLADRSIKYPVGALEDLPLQVGNLIIPCDFLVIEMIEDVNTPIILGCPLLATAVR